ANPLNLFSAPRARLSIASVNSHFLAKRGHLFGKASFGLGAQPVYSQAEGMARRREQPFPLVRLQLAREGDRRELCRMQDFIRIGVADATENARICKGPLECAVLEGKRVAKRAEITREDVYSSRVDGTQALLASENMQRCAVLC